MIVYAMPKCHSCNRMLSIRQHVNVILTDVPIIDIEPHWGVLEKSVHLETEISNKMIICQSCFEKTRYDSGV